MKHHQDLLHKEISYQIQGAAIEVRKNFGPGHKESIYQNAFAEELISRGINFLKEKSIKIYSPKTKNVVGFYKPDFLIEDKIIIEMKALEKVSKNIFSQLYDYLKNSEYELGYFINFSSPKLFIKRIIYTNDRKFSKLKEFLVVFSLILVAISVFAVKASAAEVSFYAPDKELGINSIFKIDIILDTEGESINAVEGSVVFPRAVLGIKEISDGNSIISFWIQKPKLNLDNKISFSGIIAGGYNGKGRVFSIVFQALEQGNISVAAENLKVLLNDGQGTEAKIKTKSLLVAIRSSISGSSWVPLADKEPPENFEIYLSNDVSVFGGKWFAVFSSQDKNSGIRGYEVAEKKQSIFDFLKPFNWNSAESPYVLKDQELKSDIFVRAIDNVGNQRVEHLAAANSVKWYENWLVWIIIIVIILSALLPRKKLWRKRK